MSQYDMLGFDPLDSGWVPPEERTLATTIAHDEIIEGTPIVGCTGAAFERPKWSVAWALQGSAANFEQWRRKGHIKNIRQNTGSCVGWAAAMMALYSSITDALYFGDPTRIIMPFPGYHYGLGRLESGIRGRGEGSTGSGQKSALLKYGFLPIDTQGFPQPNNGEVIDWNSAVEMEWSDGAGRAQQFISEGKKYLFQNATLATSVDQAVDLMASRYWGTTASNWGGLMQCPVVGEGNNRVLLNRRDGTWNHQQSVLGYWEHPSLGLLAAIGNQWAYAHGEDPPRVEDENTPPPAPPGVYWNTAKEFAYMVKAGETFFFSGTPNFDVRPGAYRMG